MIRRIFTLAAALSLMLSAGSFLLLLASWSCATATLPNFLKSGERCRLIRGFVLVRVTNDADRAAARWRMSQFRQSAQEKIAEHWYASAGGGDGWIFFGWNKEIEAWKIRGVTVAEDSVTGYWISPWLGVVIGSLGAGSSWGYRKWEAIRVVRRKRASRCCRCGYDLRATPDRCPECGTVVVAVTAPVNK
jgi:hypothetical protein